MSAPAIPHEFSRVNERANISHELNSGHMLLAGSSAALQKELSTSVFSLQIGIQSFSVSVSASGQQRNDKCVRALDGSWA